MTDVDTNLKIAFVSDYVSIHQKALCDALYDELKGNFLFLATSKISEKRLKMGWHDYTDSVGYAIRNSNCPRDELLDKLSQCDAIVIGSSHIAGLHEKFRDKIILDYRERPLKKGICSLLNPKLIYSLILSYWEQRSNRCYLLSAGRFAYVDYCKFYCYRNRAVKWGYFINPISKDFQPRGNDKLQILWVGRLIDWKHCEMFVCAASHLKSSGVEADFKIVGDGPERGHLQALIEQFHLQDMVMFCGNKDNDEVKKIMLGADIFISTSDSQEGWGVVVNEAMSAGCCVLASDHIGSASYLVAHGNNGILFKDRNQADLNTKLLDVAREPTARLEYAKNAVMTMNTVWHPVNAARSLVRLIGNLLGDGDMGKIEEGPCSIVD